MNYSINLKLQLFDKKMVMPDFASLCK